MQGGSGSAATLQFARTLVTSQCGRALPPAITSYLQHVNPLRPHSHSETSSASLSLSLSPPGSNDALPLKNAHHVCNLKTRRQLLPSCQASRCAFNEVLPSRIPVLPDAVDQNLSPDNQNQTRFRFRIELMLVYISSRLSRGTSTTLTTTSSRLQVKRT